LSLCINLIIFKIDNITDINLTYYNKRMVRLKSYITLKMHFSYMFKQTAGFFRVMNNFLFLPIEEFEAFKSYYFLKN
jgi:hypothetical protein